MDTLKDVVGWLRMLTWIVLILGAANLACITLVLEHLKRIG